ncbi:MAG: FAD binding domain-containing protein [Clostridiales Family XIII bacterium]|jgi:NADPH-dependent glutamate synthase beta subunit-like oxidoreductase/CO/xanthine dehydrogenase FAD-binding subunit|nr:FAD binding domain-containing protein [Clostridiales Family XIII bacterium]
MLKKHEYLRPDSLQGVVAALKSDAKNKPIAGGTDLMGTVKTRALPALPDGIVSLENAGLSYIRESAEGLHIGAAVTLHELERSEAVRAAAPLLAEAARTVASPQIRHRATLGGNLCQEPRCWYYRYPDNRFFCMRKGGERCDALTGNNAYHSVLGAAKICASPCERGCPNGTDIPAYFDAIRAGDFDKAARIFLAVNPLGAATGRVCPHNCQDACSRKEFDESVSIRDVERFLGDYISDHADRLVEKPAADSGKKVAILGGGPAGLTAAFYLRRKGHAVTVFDRNAEAGGMLRYAIPAYRLPRAIVGGLVSMLDGMGVRFALGADARSASSLADRRRDFDAVLLSCGAWKDNAIDFEGAALALSGLRFLYALRENERSGKGPEKPGEKVIVIGGGNVAIDVAVSARRLGSDVTVVYRRSRAEMPAYAHETEGALAEGVKLLECLTPHRIVLAADGRIAGLEAARSRSDGRRGGTPVSDPADKVLLEADCVIMAVGQRVDGALWDGNPDLAEGGRIVVGAGGATKLPGVFAAGDVVTGPATVVEAVAGGREAAAGIALYLAGENPARARPAAAGEADAAGPDVLLGRDPAALANSAPQPLRIAAPADRTLYAEDSFGPDETPVLREAARCLNCGCVAVTPSDAAPALVALEAEMRTTAREIPAAAFFKAGVESSTVLARDEILTEIFIPRASAGNMQSYQKFRLRNSIDFPVAGLAANLRVEDGRIRSAKLVLGAAAPTPRALPEVEAFLTGREITAETAEAAGEMAAGAMRPLAENRYKVQIFKALVKRAVSRGAIRRSV